MIRPHAAGITAFDGGELRKSFSSNSLNKSRVLSGGGSGYRSESRKPVTDGNKFNIRGAIPPSKVVKTIIHINGKRLSKVGYIPRTSAFSLPYCIKVEYLDILGNTMIITNTNVK